MARTVLFTIVALSDLFMVYVNSSGRDSAFARGSDPSDRTAWTVNMGMLAIMSVTCLVPQISEATELTTPSVQELLSAAATASIFRRKGAKRMKRKRDGYSITPPPTTKEPS